MMLSGRLSPARTKTKSVPAPVDGWNTKAALADMKPKEAVIMDNWFPMSDEIKLRRGMSEHVTGIGSAVQTLMEHASGSTRKLFAAAGSAIYDVTSAGAVGAAVVSGLTNAQWQHTIFSTTGGDYLWACNGADTPVTYNGSSWGTSTITGMSANPVWVTQHKRRLFIGEANSLKFYYLSTLAIAGAATAFDIGPICSLGGYIMGMATWTLDSGAGVDDYAVFVTSEGEAIVYQGTDPASASSWSLVGVFRIGKPIGRRFWEKFGADVIMLTESGFTPLSSLLKTDQASASKVSISDKINPTVNTSVRNYGDNFGWQTFVYPRGPWILVNVPIVEGGEAHQYVFNAITGAACRFKGWDANCWSLLDDKPYFGGDGAVYEADTGTSDNGENIEGDVKPAFSYFGSKGTQKLFSMARPVFSTTGNFEAAFDFNVDFSDQIPTATPTFSAPGASLWNQFNWNEANWGGASAISKGWRSVTGLGYSGSLRTRVSTNALEISLRSTDYIFQEGGAL